MARTAVIVVIVGLSIAALGSAPFFAAIYFSGDPTINPAIQGVLKLLSWRQSEQS
jgi:hypothetical protein